MHPGTWTRVLVDDRARRRLPISQALAAATCKPLAVALDPVGHTALPTHRVSGPRRRLFVINDRPPAECQTHHVVDWADGGEPTSPDGVVVWSHHRQVDLNRWRIVRNTDPSPRCPHWTITPVPRDQWRNKPAAA